MLSVIYNQSPGGVCNGPKIKQIKHLKKILLLFIRLPPEFLPVSGPLTPWCTSTLGAALLCSSRASSWFRAYVWFMGTPCAVIVNHEYKQTLLLIFEAWSYRIQSGDSNPGRWVVICHSAIWATVLRSIFLCLFLC